MIRAKTEHTCFLSYAREDVEQARRLYRDLRQAGATVWFDEESLRPGERWVSAIKKGILSSRYFVVLLSSQSISKRGFVQRELREALDVLSEYPEDEIFLVPARLEPCDVAHDKLRELNWVDLFPDWTKGAQKIIRLFELPEYFQSQSSKVVSSSQGDNIRQGTVEGPHTRATSQEILRFDGIYQSDRRQNYWSYLRFYEDGTAIAVSSTGSPQEVARWLTKTQPNVSKGTFTLIGKSLSFSSISEEGSVDYDGSAEGQGLILKHHSHINGNRGVTQYSFVPLHFEKNPE